MAIFSYLAIDKNGKEIKGTLDTKTREDAVNELKQSGSLVISIEEAGALNKEVKLEIFSKKPKSRDLSVFCRQFVSIIDAGVPLATALEMLGEQTNNKMLAEATLECKKSIEQGETFAHAMSLWPAVFPPMLLTLVEAGEASGSLDVSFTRMAVQFEKEAKLKQTVKKASIYPISVFIIAFAAIIVLLTFVVPTFKDVLSQLDVKMPALTVAVLAMSNFMIKRWYIVLGVVIVLVFGLRYFSKTDVGKLFFGGVQLRLPLIGDLTKKTASARAARTLETLLGSGLPLADSLTIVSNTMTNVYFKASILSARESVLLGSPLSSQFAKDTHLFPPLVRHMIGIGEETGSLEGMLSKLADYYEEEVESATERLMAALEPAIILFLALSVGTIILSIILPMAAMYNGLNNL